MPNLTDVRKNMPELKADLRKSNARATRNVNISQTQRKTSKRQRDPSDPSPNGIRDVIKDLLERHQPAQTSIKKRKSKDDKDDVG